VQNPGPIALGPVIIEKRSLPLATRELVRPAMSSGSLHPVGHRFPVANRVTYTFGPNGAKTLGRFTVSDAHKSGGWNLRHCRTFVSPLDPVQ